jgi:hypothetical protein
MKPALTNPKMLIKRTHGWVRSRIFNVPGETTGA